MQIILGTCSTGKLAALLAGALFALSGCVSSSDPSPACKQWIECQETEAIDLGGSGDEYRDYDGALKGGCWTGDQELADQCTQECEDFLVSARDALDDAGEDQGTCAE